MRFRKLVGRAAIVAAATGLLALAAAGGAGAGRGGDQLGKLNHIVVIYEENHSFDNLYGAWEGVNGRANADALHTKQVAQDGSTFACLLQNDVNLTSPPLSATCSDPAHGIASHFTNNPFSIEAYIPRD